MVDCLELVATLWWRRTAPLRVWGPDGFEALQAATLDFLAPATALRVGGSQPVLAPPPAAMPLTRIAPGVLLEEGDPRIEAFASEHGDIDPAFGLRITAADRVFVISGDTRYCERLEAMARGADVLVREVIPDAALSEPAT